MVPTPSSHSKDLRYSVSTSSTSVNLILPRLLFLLQLLNKYSIPSTPSPSWEKREKNFLLFTRMLKAWGVKGTDVSWRKGIAAHSPLQQRLWLKGTEKHSHTCRQQALLAGQQSMVALWVNLCQPAKEEPFNYGLPQAALPYAGQPNFICYLKLAVLVGPFYLPCPPLALCFSRDALLILEQEPHLKHGTHIIMVPL